MRSLISPQIDERRLAHEVERAADRAFGRILDRHDRVVGLAALRRAEHLVDRRAAAPRRRTAPKCLRDRGVAERARRARGRRSRSVCSSARHADIDLRGRRRRRPRSDSGPRLRGLQPRAAPAPRARAGTRRRRPSARRSPARARARALSRARISRSSASIAARWRGEFGSWPLASAVGHGGSRRRGVGATLARRRRRRSRRRARARRASRRRRG